MAIYEVYNDENIIKWRKSVVEYDEGCYVVLYGVYSTVGAFLSNGAYPGYMAVTKKNRVICHFNNIYGSNDFYFTFDDIQHIKIERGLLDNLIVVFTYLDGKKKRKLKFNTPKNMKPELFAQHKFWVKDLEEILKKIMADKSNDMAGLESEQKKEVNAGSKENKKKEVTKESVKELSSTLDGSDIESMKTSDEVSKEFFKDNCMRELYDEIMNLGDIAEENGINIVKSKMPVDENSIVKWQNENGITLPEEYKALLLLSNGIKYGMTSICPIEQVKKDRGQFDGYYVIGDFIGDGSLLLMDDDGKIYEGDHELGIKETEFKQFIESWIIDALKDDLKEYNLL